MDSLRDFPYEEIEGPAAAAEPEDDVRFDAPPVIGTDERRMHVRAYNFWAQMLNERSYPSIEDLDLDNLSDFGGNSVLLDFTSGLENPAVSYIGPALQAACDITDDIAYISQVPSRSLLSRLTDHYLQIIANQAPVGFEAEFQNQSGVNIMYRGILLPFSSDDDTIDFIMGVINWKEVAAEVDHQAIASELDASVRALSATVQRSDALWPQDAGAGDKRPAVLATADIVPFRGDAIPELNRDGDDMLPIGWQSDEDDALSSEFAVSEPAIGASLADWLAVARECADVARSADARGRSALYDAIGRAYDFSLVAEAYPEDYQDLLADAGLTIQDRAPMTPIVKLVFGADYDKTRVTEYATVIAHARDQVVGQGGLPAYLVKYDGGLKAIVKTERAAKRGGAVRPASKAVDSDALRTATPMGFVELQAGDNEFVLLVGRKASAEQVAVVGALNDPALLEKVLKKLLG